MVVGITNLVVSFRIGGYAGAAILRSGFRVIILSDWSKTLSFILIAPLIGIVLGLIFMVTALWLCPDKAPQPVDAWFRRVQHRARQQ